MLTSIFKNNLISYISIPVLGILLWTLSFYNRSLFLPIKLNIGIDSYSISILYIYIITYVITILTGFFINSKVKKHLFSYEPSNLTFLFYVLLISLSISATSYFWIILSTIIIALIAIFEVRNCNYQPSPNFYFASCSGLS